MASELSKLDRAFVEKAAQDGVAEIEMAKLARKKATSTELRHFADMMLKEHGETKDKLAKMAEQLGLRLSTEPSGEHRKMLDDFANYDGEEFDKQFISTTLEEHEKDIGLYQSESEHGHNEELKRYAVEITPILKKHLDAAKSMHHGM